jgi:hypothetical protein
MYLLFSSSDWTAKFSNLLFRLEAFLTGTVQCTLNQLYCKCFFNLITKIIAHQKVINTVKMAL